MESGKLNINIIANRITESDSLSGGERIFIELAARWAQKGHIINIFTSKEGYELCERYKLNQVNGIHFTIWSSSKANKYNSCLWFVVLAYIFRTIEGSIKAMRVPPTSAPRVIVFSSSPFWPDSIPALILHRKIKKSRLIVGFYLFAPNPFKGGYRTWYERKVRLSSIKDWSRALALYLNHLPIYWWIRKYADLVFVTNEIDRYRFVDKRLTLDKVIAVQGGVDTKSPRLVPEPRAKKYQAVFIGRFHPQKGVLELIDIWKQVCQIKKDARLAMIGNGPLERDVKRKIKEYGLGKNIDLLGFKDGTEKIKIFKLGRIVLHPAVYDSGGMAACEAMICGLPGVSFDLPALKTYYPKGMIKTPLGQLKEFANNIIDLLEDEELYKRTRDDAVAWAQGWDWDKRANEVLDKTLSSLGWSEK